MPSRKVEDLDFRLQYIWKMALEEWDDPEVTPFLTCTHRSNAEQDELYAQGRTKPGKKVTNAKGGESPHNQLPAQAFDVAFKNKAGELRWETKYFEKFAKLVKTINFVVGWGGDWEFNDRPHFEVMGWKANQSS